MDSVFQDAQTTRYAQLSACSIILFDHLITLNDEVSLIWDSGWSPGKIIFLINRYYNLGGAIFTIYALFLATKTDDFCLRTYQWQGWNGILAFMMAEAILQLRIYALYSLNKKLLTVMLFFYFACSTCSAWIVFGELSSISIMTAPPAILSASVDGSFCSTLLPRGIFRYWIPMLSFECLLCVLALFQGFRRFRSDSSIFRSGKRLVSSLIRDSIIYFLLIFATYLTCLLVWAFARQTFIEVPIGFSVTMSCVLANRVMLNCRKISKSVTCTVSGMKISTTGRTMIVVDDYDDYGATNEGGKKEVFSCSEERRADELGITNIDYKGKV